MSKLASEFWVKAYIKRLSLVNVPAFVVAHGDDTSGIVLIKVNRLNGQARLMQKRFDFQQDGYIWSELTAGDEGEVDASIQKQCGMDPDLWVIEIEDPEGRDFLELGF